MNKKTKTALKGLAVLLIPIAVAYSFTSRYEIRVNTSESLAGKVYLLDKWNKVVERNKKMAFKAEKNGYYEGDFVKLVKGMPGDEVIRHEGEVVISYSVEQEPLEYGQEIWDKMSALVNAFNASEGNPERVAFYFVGYIKEKGRKGQDLTPGPTGMIPEGHYFMAGSHKDSFDSRYKSIGYVKDSDIIGSIYTIL